MTNTETARTATPDVPLTISSEPPDQAEKRERRREGARKAAATLRARREQEKGAKAAAQLVQETLDRITAKVMAAQAEDERHALDPPGTARSKELIARAREHGLERDLYRVAHRMHSPLARRSMVRTGPHRARQRPRQSDREQEQPTQQERTPKMSIKLHVSVSRKVGTANYGSNGGTCGLEIELATGLLADPPKLAETIRRHFALCETAVDEELAKLARPATNGTAIVREPVVTAAAPPAANGHAPPRNGARAPERPATEYDEPHGRHLADNFAVDDHDEAPPTTGGQLLGWARKQPHDAKGFFIRLGRKRGYPSRVLDWSEEQVTTVYQACRQTAATGR